MAWLEVIYLVIYFKSDYEKKKVALKECMKHTFPLFIYSRPQNIQFSNLCDLQLLYMKTSTEKLCFAGKEEKVLQTWMYPEGACFNGGYL